MRIAIVYRGHFKRGSRDHRANKKRKTNCFTGEILENNIKNLSTSGNQIDYYYHTYCHPVTLLSSNEGLLKIFESKGIKIKKYSTFLTNFKRDFQQIQLLRDLLVVV